MPSFEAWDPKPEGWVQISDTAWALGKDSYTAKGSDSVFVMIDPNPPPFELHGDPRAEWYLNWLDRLVRELAAYRRWDTTALADAREFCLTSGLEARFSTSWKASPDRSMKASASLLIDEDGNRQVSIKVIRRNGEPVAFKSETFEPFLIDYFTWRKMARQIRWISPNTVVIDDGLQGKGYPRLPGPTEISLEV